MTQLEKWLEYIAEIHQKRIDLGLDRIREVALRLSVIQTSATVITVGGTNGKGSTCALLGQIYVQAGYQVGIYSSPHICMFNERVSVNGQHVSDQQLVDAFEKIEFARKEIPLSFFEFITLAALLIFQQHDLDIILLEVGLGGRLDAVNIIDSDVAVVTSIDLDHMNWLGETREAIAIEKACIARKGKPFISGELNPPDTLLKTAQSLGAVSFQAGKDFFLHSCLSGYEWGCARQVTFTFDSFHLKPENISTALMVATHLQSMHPVSDGVIKNAIKQTMLSGRFEVLRDFPMVLDVAHNPASAAWLKEQYQARFPNKKTVALIGMLSDKSMNQTAEILNACVDVWCVAGLDCPRGDDGLSLFEFLKTQSAKKCYHFDKVADSLDHLFSQKHPVEFDQLIVFGSFHTVAETKKWVKARVSTQMTHA